MSIFDLLPKNHFAITDKVLKQIAIGESVLVYGVYGAGVQYFIKSLEHTLSEDKKYEVLFFRGALIKDNPIDLLTKQIIKTDKAKDIDTALKKFNETKKLIIMIDSFQQITNASVLLDFLGVLRKSNPHNIINIISMDHSYLSDFKQDNAFNDAAVSAVYLLEPFNLEGTRRIIEINNKFFDWQIPINYFAQIYKLSGGNPRLIKYISKVATEEGLSMLDNLEALANHNLLEAKLHKFIDLFFKFDTKHLKTIGILDTKLEIRSEVLRYKIENYEIPNLSELMPELSKKERRIFSFLFLHKGKLISKDKFDFLLNLTEDNYSLWASYKAINRLKQKIKTKFELKNIKGKGYILENLG